LDTSTDYTNETEGRGDGETPVFRLKGISRHWQGAPGFNLQVPELAIDKGEKVALVGHSGCGKSTLLDMLAMILKPTEAHSFEFFSDQETGGRRRVMDVMGAWQANNQDALSRVRMRHMGYVLQTGGLFPFLSVRDNIGLNRKGLGLTISPSVEKVAAKLDIESHLDKLPGQLSVGERQRVAIARAMAHKPAVVIADEPTASLDPINAEKIMALFSNLADDFQVTLVVATHDWERVAEGGFRRITFDLKQTKPDGAVQVTACA
jgi:putative ABC transport system ATP-binding protein